MNYLEFFGLLFGPFMAFCGAAWVWDFITGRINP